MFFNPALELPASASAGAGADLSTVPATPAPALQLIAPVMVAAAVALAAKLAELKTLLKPRLVLELINLELDHRGRKADLLRRLKEHLVSHDATAPCTPAVLLKHTTQTTVHRSRPSQGESFTIVTISQQKQCED